MTILDRYIIRGILANYLIALLVMVGLYITLDLLVNLDEFTEDGKPVGRVLQNMADYYGCNLFLYFAQLSGVITLVAAACTLARMQIRNELTGVLAAGTSLHRVAVPVIGVGLLLNGLVWVDRETILPRIAHNLARPHDDVEGRRTFEVWFLEDRDGALLSATQFHPGSQQIRNLMVMQRNPDGVLREVIRADWAEWDAARSAWRLKRGIAYEHQPAGLDLSAVEPAQGRPVEWYPLRHAHPSDLSPREIRLRQSVQWVTFLSIGQLDRLMTSGATSPVRLAQVKHTRIVEPFVNLLLLLLGIPFFLHREPTSVLANGAACLLACGLCFVATFVCHNLMTAETYPALPAWLPIFVFGPVAVVILESIRT